MARLAPSVPIADTLGAPPEGYRSGLYDPDSVIGHSVSASQTFVSPGPGSAGLRTTANRSASKINLRGVAEVLSEFGLDPVSELAKAVQAVQPVTDRSGRPVLDANGHPTYEPLLDIDTRTRVLQDLTQYVHPKLKSVEVTVKRPELTEEQLNERIAALQAKAAIQG